jgi:hypothetical protein
LLTTRGSRGYKEFNVVQINIISVAIYENKSYSD